MDVDKILDIRMLQILNIDKEKLKKYPYELSGGECQRVAIARALVVNPALILTDEPTGALDEKNTKKISEILIDINKAGIPVVMVTHDTNMAQIGKKIIYMKDGSF